MECARKSCCTMSCGGDISRDEYSIRSGVDWSGEDDEELERRRVKSMDYSLY